MHNALRAVCALALAGTACVPRGAAPPPIDPDPDRARAALATIHVLNETTLPLSIAYRIAGNAAGEVGIGRVDANAEAEMAPVPAGEPLILSARTAAGTELTLPPRTFAIDGAWTWRIERGSRFVTPARSR